MKTALMTADPKLWYAYLDLEGSSSGLLPFLASVRNLSKPKGSSSSFSLTNLTGPSRCWVRSVPANPLSGWNLWTEKCCLHNWKRSTWPNSSLPLFGRHAFLHVTIQWTATVKKLVEIQYKVDDFGLQRQEFASSSCETHLFVCTRFSKSSPYTSRSTFLLGR